MMYPLFKAVLLRTFTFLIWTLFSAWLFSVVEQTEMDNTEEKYQLLLSLFNSMASKYNMTIDEFNTFSSAVYEALSEPRTQWNYYNAIDFTFQVFTTIGKLTWLPYIDISFQIFPNFSLINITFPTPNGCKMSDTVAASNSP